MTTLAFWKPHGVLTRFTDDAGRPNLSDWIDRRDVYPAGRLDRDSEGLLLLCSDPRLRGRLTASHHPRVYLVQVEGVMDEPALDGLRAGVVVGERRAAPAEARVIGEPEWLPPRDPPIRYRANIPDMWLELTLREGRNRQVRRMTAAVGHPTLRLVRWAVGPVTLDGLTPGEWRHLSRSEIDELWSALR